MPLNEFESSRLILLYDMFRTRRTEFLAKAPLEMDVTLSSALWPVYWSELLSALCKKRGNTTCSKFEYIGRVAITYVISHVDTRGRN